MRIAVYSGEIPGTTFIERLVLGLAHKNKTILLFGNKKGAVSYPANVQVYAMPEGKLNMLLYAAANILKLAIKYPKDVTRVAALVKNYSGENKFRYLLKILPVVLHRPDVFHIQWAKSLKEWAWVRGFGIKLVVSLRGSHINYSPVVDLKLASLYKHHFPTVHAFHAVSNDIGDKASGFGAHSIKTIYSGLPLKDFDFLNGYKKHNDRFEIISVGRWHWVKGFNYAIDAINILRKQGSSFHYTIVAGNGTEEAIYHIKSLGLEEYISVLPELPHSEVINHLKNADVLLVPSVSEGIANVALEAMAVGTTVLSTECGGISEVIKDGYNGFLVPARDSRSIADRISYISGLSTDQLQLIRHNARKTVEEQHDIDKMVDEFLGLYQNVMLQS
jgi:glycosyltransferase involved in cell wall biosynthesis